MIYSIRGQNFLHNFTNKLFRFYISEFVEARASRIRIRKTNLACARTLDPFHIVSYHMKWVKTSLTFSIEPSGVWSRSRWRQGSTAAGHPYTYKKIIL